MNQISSTLFVQTTLDTGRLIDFSIFPWCSSISVSCDFHSLSENEKMNRNKII